MRRELEAARRLGEQWSLRQARILEGDAPGTELVEALIADQPLLAAWSRALPKERAASESASFEDAPASALSAHFRLLLLRRQQFLSLERPMLDRLEAIYARVVSELGALLATDRGGAFGSELEELLDVEHRELTRFLAELPGAGERTTCGEYSAELQLEVLGIPLDELAEPVLDVGCGEQALLVRWLSERGFEAFGLDRHARGPRVIRADWLSFEFGVNRFGTIVSHQAFSLHFLRHHLAVGELARRYAVAYRAILGSLRKNGSFVYAPGLPFIERLLPEPFVVERTPLPPGLAGYVRQAFAASGEDVAYACHVSRR